MIFFLLVIISPFFFTFCIVQVIRSFIIIIKDRRSGKNGSPVMRVSTRAKVAFYYSLLLLIPLVAQYNASDTMFSFYTYCGLVLTFIGILLGVYSLIVMRWIEKNVQGKTIVNTAICLSAFCLIICAPLLPTYIDFRDYNSFSYSAKSAGGNAKLAQEAFYEKNDRYTKSLSDLLVIDPQLTQDPNVTFGFLYASQSGFVLYTKHSKTFNPRRRIYYESSTRNKFSIHDFL